LIFTSTDRTTSSGNVPIFKGDEQKAKIGREARELVKALKQLV
jgi:hypothetical protein